MSNVFYAAMERAKQNAEPDDSWEKLDKLIEAQIKDWLNEEWAVGFKDRGMGHGDYAVVLKSDNTIIIAESGNSPHVAEYLVKLHNESLEKK
jgi:hypothetical protein